MEIWKDIKENNKHPELYNEIIYRLNNYQVTPHEYSETISVIPQNT